MSAETTPLSREVFRHRRSGKLYVRADASVSTGLDFVEFIDGKEVGTRRHLSAEQLQRRIGDKWVAI